VTGGSAVGLVHRMPPGRDLESGARRAALRLARPGLADGSAAVRASVAPALACAYVFPDDTYSGRVLGFTTELAGDHELLTWCNRWGGPGAPGVATRWLDRGTGHAFDVVMHTPDGWAALEAALVLFARQRERGRSPRDVRALQAMQESILRRVTVPPGARGLEPDQGSRKGMDA
jgi:hypothetical protein